MEGIIRRITGELGYAPRVIATSGIAETIAAETRMIHEVDEKLTMSGLYQIYCQNREDG